MNQQPFESSSSLIKSKIPGKSLNGLMKSTISAPQVSSPNNNAPKTDKGIAPDFPPLPLFPFV